LNPSLIALPPPLNLPVTFRRSAPPPRDRPFRCSNTTPLKLPTTKHVYRTYNRLPALFVQGAGCNLWDNRGNEYLDFLAGIAVCFAWTLPSVRRCGHHAPGSTAHSCLQISCSPRPKPQLATRLCGISGMDRAFFCCDGTTAIEGAIKIAKKHGNRKRPDGDYEIVTLPENRFTVAAMGAFRPPASANINGRFDPMVPGFIPYSGERHSGPFETLFRTKLPP